MTVIKVFKNKYNTSKLQTQKNMQITKKNAIKLIIKATKC